MADGTIPYGAGIMLELVTLDIVVGLGSGIFGVG